MSWGEYLSNLQRDGLKHAAICGLDGPAGWLQVTDDSNVSDFLSIESNSFKSCVSSYLLIYFRNFVFKCWICKTWVESPCFLIILVSSKHEQIFD